MDYYLENEHMGMLEKNKEFFAQLGLSEKKEEEKKESVELGANSYKMYEIFIKEKDGILKIIKEMCGYVLNSNIKENTIITSNKSFIELRNRIIMILYSYLEQPGLLDPILPNIIPLMTNTMLELINKYLKSNSNEQKIIFENILSLSQIIYNICKIRGFGPISKFFSSEVSIFENVINFLISLPLVHASNWTVNYVLILWSSLLAMVPFDIDTIDSKGFLINNLFSYLKEELLVSSNIRDISAYSLSKFLTRPDLIKKKYLVNYMNESIKKMMDQKENGNIFKMLGICLSLCELFKNGLPKDLEEFVGSIVEKLISYEFPENIKSSGVWRKTFTKLIQRVALVMLKPRPQTWRYKIKIRTALEKQDNSEIKEEEKNEIKEEEKDELDYEVNFEYLETIIDFLINNLSDKEYIVRWSAAKGLGRLCERLTKSMVEEIFGNLFELLKDLENEYAWNGTCLCIAELCKRGMILPERLFELIPHLEQALLFEIDKGTFVTGSNVRDSACYIVWALARAFTTDIMKKYVERLAKTLILTILFDKEVNCRRAASAAFQENIGRQGNFPHGIEILTEADYFTLGSRNNCYFNISIFIAQYEEYYKPIVDYLYTNRLIHVEPQIRDISATALSLLVPFNPKYFVDEIIPKLIKNCTSPSLRVRHGNLIGIGYILLGLNGKWDFYHKSRINRNQMLNSLSNKDRKILADSNYRKEFEKYYDSIKYINNLEFLTSKKELTREIIELVKKIDEAKLYRGKGSEIMRNGVNDFIKLFSEVKLEINEDDFIYFHDILIDNIRQSKNDIQDGACESLKIFNLSYGKDFGNNEKVMNKLESIFLDMINQSVNNDNIHVTKGYTSAIVTFNHDLLFKHYDLLIDSLIKNTKMKYNQKNELTKNNDPITRKCAIESLSYISIKYLNEKEKDLDKIIEAILNSFNDYEIDPKIGDVGSNVRMAAVTGILNIIYNLYINKKFEIFDKYLLRALNEVFRQLAEKIPLVRKITGNEIQKFFYLLKDEDKEFMKTKIPKYEELTIIFLTDIDFDDNENVFNIKWIESEFSYPKIMPIIELDEYNESFIEGLIRSISCISEDVHKASINELKKVLEKKGNEKKALIEKIFKVSLDIFKKHAKDDKFIESLESTLSYLLSINLFINNDYIEYYNSIYTYVRNENIDNKNIHKILNSIDIYYNLLFIEREEKYNVINKSLKSLLFLMCHKYPVVRKKAAEKLYLFLSGIDDYESFGLSDEDFEHINSILTEVDWTEKVINIKERRNTIADLLKIKLK